MRVETQGRRRENQISKAICAVKNGMSYRQACLKFHIPKSTLFDRVHKSKLVKVGLRRQPALNPYEEQLTVNLLLRFADRGIPMKRKQCPEAAHIIVS